MGLSSVPFVPAFAGADAVRDAMNPLLPGTGFRGRAYTRATHGRFPVVAHVALLAGIQTQPRGPRP